MSATIIVTDPFAQTRARYEVIDGTRLSDALMEISPTRWNGSVFELYEGAVGPGGAVEAEGAASIHVKDGEIYQVVVLPAEPISAAIIIAAGVAAGSTAAILISIAVHVAIMAITMAISYLATMLLTPKKQSSGALSPDDQPSGLNTLQAPRNAFRLGSRIADIYGTMRFWPDLIFNATSVWNPLNWDYDIGSWSENARATSQQDVRAVYSLGRGHFQLSDFKFGDADAATANGAVYVYPPGVTLPANITATYGVANLTRQELGGPGAINMWSPWYEIPSDLVHTIHVQIAFPAGLILTVSGKKVPPGYVERMQADIRIQLERLDESGAVIASEERQRVYESKTRNELRVTSQEAVTPGRYRVRVAEVYDYVPYPNGNTYTAIKKVLLEGIVGHRTLTDAERTFAHETVLVVEANNIGGPALQNLENFNVLATRMLPTQDVPGIMTEFRGDGRWITAAIHTLTDPYICNYPMDEVDWQSLHDVQASLDGYGEPFGEGGFHAALDRGMTADEQLMLVARKARSFVFPSGGKMTFARDERRAGVAALFNRRNRLLGRSDIGMGLQFAGRDDPDGVVISWTDADNGYRTDTFTYPEAVTPANPLTMDLVGAVHKWEICRRARFELAQILYRRRTMPIRVTEEGQLLLPFDRVAIVMPWDEGVSDGEVLEVDGLSLRLSRVVPEGLTDQARIRLRAPDGRQTALIPVAADSLRGPNWVVLGEAPVFIILGEHEDRQLGTLYSLSLTEANDKATHWIATGAEIDDQGVALTCMEDADEVFQLSDDLFDPCLDEDPLLWNYASTTGGNYDGGGFAFPTPVCDPGDVLLVFLGATGPNYALPAGWTQIEKIDSAVTTLGEARSMLVCYRTVEPGEPSSHFFSRSGGTLSAGWMTRLGVNRAHGSILYSGAKTTAIVRATGRSFTTPGIEITHPNSVVWTGIVAGATIYTDPWPQTEADLFMTWVQESTMSWTPGVRPVYACTVYDATPAVDHTGPTGTMYFTIPTNSNPANNLLFTTVSLCFHYDPSTGGTLVPKGGGSGLRALAAPPPAFADIIEGEQAPIFANQREASP